jgi:hypothetical protein
MPGNQSIRRGRLDPCVPRGNDGSQQGKRHHGNAYAENREQASQLVAHSITQKKSNQLH